MNRLLWIGVASFFMALFVPAMSAAQYELVITNVADIPLTQSHTVSVGIRWNGTGTNDLFNNGINGAAFGLRIVNSGSTVAALKLTAPPYSSTTSPSNTEVLKNSLFTNPQTNRGPTSSSGFFTNVSGTTKILGTFISVNGTNGIKPANALSGTILPLADFILYASDTVTGPIILQAGFLQTPLTTNFVYGDPATGQPFDSLIANGLATFNVIAIPEPTTWAMIILSIASGVGGLVYFKRHHLHSAEKQLAVAQEGVEQGE
ncbi:MAG: hypothetical protein QM703_29325 [Gemmatales bacterium]